MIKNLLFVLLFIPFLSLGQSQAIKIMLVTGGHAFDTLQFFQLFDSFEEIEYDHFEQPQANNELAKGIGNDYDVLVFYDMWKNISPEEKAAYISLTKKGQSFLFLHHSLVSYQNWSAFEKIVGGKYVQENKRVPEEDWSDYEHDVWIYAEVERITPVTSGLKQLRFFDEAYDNVRISEEVKPLLSTKHPKSMEYIAWENRFNQSTIIYLQSGHDRRTYEDSGFRKLLKQSIYYLANSNKSKL